MAASSNIGQVQTMYLQTTDAFGEKVETNISKGMRINQYATFEQVDRASRAITALLKNSYNDTILVTNVSVNEVMTE